MITLVEAQNLQFGDTVIFQGETYYIVETEENSEGSINVRMNPLDRFALDRHFAFPKPFTFELISRL